jgi:hypothetical protein
MKPGIALALFVFAASPAAAQLPDWVTPIIAAAELPVVAAQARNDGIAAGEVRAAIEALERARVRAGDARVVLQEARDAHREHGPVDNFGAFVQARLDAGLRGRELAAAIRAEHAARGRGRGSATDRSNQGRRPDTAAQRGRGGRSGAGSDTAAQRGKAGTPARPTQGTRGQTKRPTTDADTRP